MANHLRKKAFQVVPDFIVNTLITLTSDKYKKKELSQACYSQLRLETIGKNHNAK